MKKLVPLIIFLFIIGCTSDRTADNLYSLGLDHFENQEYLNALQKFNEALQLDENYAMAYLKRAQVHLIKDDYESAFYDLNRFIEFDTLVSEGYTQRAILKFSLTDYYGALSDCNKALEADEQNADAYRMRGRIKTQFGNYPGAYKDLSEAINLNEKDKKSYILRGDVNMIQANTTEACKDYNQAAELGSMQAYKRIVEYCSPKESEAKFVTKEKPKERVVIKEKIVEKQPAHVEKSKVEADAIADPMAKWHRLPDVRSNIYQINTISINRQIRKEEPINWGTMGPMDHAYLLITQKETNVFNLQFIVEGEKTYDAFYKYIGPAEENKSLYKRVDGNWDEHLVLNKPLEFVLERLQTEDRTILVMTNYTRGVGAKILF